MVQFDLLPSPPPPPPRATLGTSPAVRARGLGVGQIKNNFSLILRGACYFLCGLDEDYVCSRENVGICRRVLGEK